MFAGASGSVIRVYGSAIIVIAIWWGNGYVFAGASYGVVTVGSATIVVVAV